MSLGLSPPRALLSIQQSSPLCGFGSLSYCLCYLVTDPKGYPTSPPNSCAVLASAHLYLGASVSLSLDSNFPSDYFDHTLLIALSVSFPPLCMPDPPGAALAPSIRGLSGLPLFLLCWDPLSSHRFLISPPVCPALNPHLCLFLSLSLRLSPPPLSPPSPLFKGCRPGVHFSAHLQPPACA